MRYTTDLFWGARCVNCARRVLTGGRKGDLPPYRTLVKGNSLQRDMHRTQGRARVKQALERIRRAAEREKGGKLTSLSHHIYSVDTLREAYDRLEREASPGVDGITWR